MHDCVFFFFNQQTYRGKINLARQLRLSLSVSTSAWTKIKARALAKSQSDAFIDCVAVAATDEKQEKKNTFSVRVAHTHTTEFCSARQRYIIWKYLSVLWKGAGFEFSAATQEKVARFAARGKHTLQSYALVCSGQKFGILFLSRSCTDCVDQSALFALGAYILFRESQIILLTK